MGLHFFLAFTLTLAGWAGVSPAVRAEVASAAKPYDYYAIGDLDAPRPGRTEGGLLLFGGGEWDYEAFRWFVRQAGNGHLVVLRASGAAEAQEEFYRQVGGLASVQTLVFHAREPASDPKVLEILRRADGIFIAGGDQSNYVRYWKGTPLHEALNRHVRDGKPLGGTSAGLAIMGAYGYGAMDGGSITSDEALRDPMGPAVTMVGDFLALPPLPPGRVITDTHFSERQRLGRLLAFLAQMMAKTGRDDLRGLGIDEDTALCIDAQGEGRLYSSSDGWAWLVVPTRAPHAVAGEPLGLAGWRLVAIGPDSRLRLPGFEVDAPVQEATAEVIGGRLKVVPSD